MNVVSTLSSEQMGASFSFQTSIRVLIQMKQQVTPKKQC